APRRLSAQLRTTTTRMSSPRVLVDWAKPWSAPTSTTSRCRTASQSAAGSRTMADIREILNLERIDRDIYRGPVIESILQRTFGGQVAAQSLVAATRTVEEG